MGKRLLVIMLALCMTLSIWGCTEQKPTEETNTTETVTDEPVSPLQLVENGESKYVVVRAENANKEVVNAAIALRDAIREATGVSLRIINDEEPETDYEIVVGDTKRSASITLSEELKSEDYAIINVGNTLCVCGGSTAKTVEAVDAFVSAYLNESAEALQFTSEMVRVEKAEYIADAVKIGTHNLSDYVIICSTPCPAGESDAAFYLQSMIRLRFGTVIPVISTITPHENPEIIVGTANRNFEFYKTEEAKTSERSSLILFDGDRISLGGTDIGETSAAVRYFCNVYLNESMVRNKTLEVVCENRIIPTRGVTYSTMSFNLKYGVERRDARATAALNVILSAMPDTIGVQECDETWYSVLTEKLAPWYDVVGELNHESQNWRNAIFYRRDVFKLVETKTQWLSTTPDVESKLKESGQYRILTSVVLEDRVTGQRLAHYNTHMDFVEKARPAQWRVLKALLDRCQYPMVVTGDFNTYSDTTYYASLTNGGYDNAFEMTYNHDSAPTSEGSVIDFVFVTDGKFNVLRHEVFDGTYPDVAPSDHNAVMVWYTLYPEAVQ